MAPRHFWWMLETLDDGKTTKRGLTDDDKARLLRLLQDAKKGKP